MVSSSSWPLKMFSEISRAQFGSLPPIPKNRDPTTGFVTKREHEFVPPDESPWELTESPNLKIRSRHMFGKFHSGATSSPRDGGTKQ